MKYIKIILGFIICFYSINSFAQTNSSPATKKHNFVFYAGVGPNIYFNNLVLAKKLVNEVNYSFAGRIMWEPEHLLSLGIESGYYRLYTINIDEQQKASIANDAVPIQIVISMKFTKHLYVNFNSGQTILINKVESSKYGTINATTLSLSDFAGSVGYRRKVKDRISLGAEAKFFYASKLDDKNIALLFFAGFSF